MSKTKIFVIAIVGAILLFRLLTCNWEVEKAIATIKPENIVISGDLSEYLQVVDNKYEVTENYGGHLSIKVKAIKPFPANELKGKKVDLIVSLIGENGAPISGTGPFSSNATDQLIAFLVRGSGEEVISMTTQLGSYWAEEHADKAKKFVVTSKIENIEEVEATTQSLKATPNEVASSDGSKNWDKVLDDYEKYVNEYIKFFKLAKNGDESAVAQSLEILQKSTDLQVSLQQAQGDNNLSAGQGARLNKLLMKLASNMKE